MMMNFFKLAFKGTKKRTSQASSRRLAAKINKLSFQHLEARNLLAGIYFSSGEVTIAGDASSNVGSFIEVD
eukprot:COSAG01_NODE_14648_length_1426_cov_11.171063_2_plen_70_part_01